MSVPEDRARALGGDRTDLFRRLLDARATMSSENRKLLGDYRFDFEQKRLVGRNGCYLQWMLRPHPDRPVGYRNQQTSVGYVVFYVPADKHFG